MRSPSTSRTRIPRGLWQQLERVDVGADDREVAVVEPGAVLAFADVDLFHVAEVSLSASGNKTHRLLQRHGSPRPPRHQVNIEFNNTDVDDVFAITLFGFQRS